jgi:hypothetical protein
MRCGSGLPVDSPAPRAPSLAMTPPRAPSPSSPGAPLAPRHQPGPARQQRRARGGRRAGAPPKERMEERKTYARCRACVKGGGLQARRHPGCAAAAGVGVKLLGRRRGTGLTASRSYPLGPARRRPQQGRPDAHGVLTGLRSAPRGLARMSELAPGLSDACRDVLGSCLALRTLRTAWGSRARAWCRAPTTTRSSWRGELTGKTWLACKGVLGRCGGARGSPPAPCSRACPVHDGMLTNLCRNDLSTWVCLHASAPSQRCAHGHDLHPLPQRLEPPARRVRVARGHRGGRQGAGGSWLVVGGGMAGGWAGIAKAWSLRTVAARRCTRARTTMNAQAYNEPLQQTRASS